MPCSQRAGDDYIHSDFAGAGEDNCVDVAPAVGTGFGTKLIVPRRRSGGAVSAAANAAHRFDHEIVAPAPLAGKCFAAERVHHVVATHALGASATVGVIVSRNSRDNLEAQSH
jgi:hypothetical protein